MASGTSATPSMGKRWLAPIWRPSGSSIFSRRRPRAGTQLAIPRIVRPAALWAEQVFAALGDGGVVNMPLGKTFFATSFWMVNDRFGVALMVQG
jgi:uncharacterized glyoxalase superfamily protein PhnB